MAFIDHHKRIVLVCQIAHLIDLSDISIHGENTIRNDHLESVIGCCGSLQLGFQIRHVIVGIPKASCLAQPNTIDDTRMVQ